MKHHPEHQHDPIDKLAAIIALAGHPAILGCLGFIMIVLTTTQDFNERLFYLILLTLMTFIPAALYLFVHFKGNVLDMLELIDREARLIPYILMIGGAVAAIITLVGLHAPRPIFIMTLILLANEVVLGTINFWTKISIHTATASFTALMLGYLVDPNWYWLLLLVPVIGWSRVYRRRHTRNQVVGGGIFATVITGLVLVLSHFYL